MSNWACGKFWLGATFDFGLAVGMGMAALGKADIEGYLNSVDLSSPLQEALNAAVSVQTYQPLPFFADFFVTKEFISSFG